MKTHRSLALAAVLGVAAFALGLMAARSTLPEWQAAPLPDPAQLRQRFQELVAPLDFELRPGEPRLYLSSHGDTEYVSLRDQAHHQHRLLGKRAAAERIAQRRGLHVKVLQEASWSGGIRGQLTLTFGADGRPWAIEWLPLELSAFLDPTAERRPPADTRSYVASLLAPGETVGQPTEGNWGGYAVTWYPIAGSHPPELVSVGVAAGQGFFCARRLGTVADDRATAGRGFSGMWTQMGSRALLFLAALGLFLVLLARRRIDLTNALLLSGPALAASVLGALGQTLANPPWFLWLNVTLTVLFITLFLFMVWAAGESWLRAARPDLAASFDLLRTGRLGPEGARALLFGWAAGALLAGVEIGLQLLSTLAPSAYPVGPSVRLPLWRTAGHPLLDGPVSAGLAMLALALAWRLLPRGWATAAAVAMTALLLLPEAAVAPWWAGYLALLPVAAILVLTLARGGLTALLTAAVIAQVLPAAVYAAQFPGWLPGSLGLTAGLTLALPLLGVIGLGRPFDREAGPVPVPAFVRRLEEERRLRYEMDLLSRMQEGLLPRPPEVAGYEIAARSLQANEAGGDLYDFLWDERRRLWVAVGDVAGHGYSCAIEMAMIKAILATLVRTRERPSEILTEVDRVLRSTRDLRLFTSLALLRLEPDSGRCLFANAGYPYPRLVTRDETEEIRLPGLPLGQGPGRTYEDVSLALPADSCLVFTSDGLYESRDSRGIPYGFERAGRLLAHLAGLDAQEVLDRMLEDWRRHLGAQPPDDDTSVVVLKRRQGAAGEESVGLRVSQAAAAE